MIARLLSSLRRRLGSRRRLAIATAGLLALAVVASALAPATRQEDRKSALPVRTRTGGRAQTTTVIRGRPPVSVAQLRRARAVAVRFLHGYLPFAYGRARADQVTGVTAPLRRQLTTERALVAPTERRRHPRVVSLAVVGQAAPRVVLATALVEDGGVTAYALRITLQEGGSGWLVSAVDGG